MAVAQQPPFGDLEPPQLVALLDVEPDLAAGVDELAAAKARRLTPARLVAVPEGPWRPSSLIEPGNPTGPFAAFVIGGLLAREIELADRTTTQLLGPGDLIPLAEPDEAVPGATYTCRAVTPVELAVLDERFLGAAQRWPWLAARMAERAARWADRALMMQAISQLTRVDARIVALLWHLAERWGRVSPAGLFLPLRLTHEALGRLVGARRSTISLALKDLRDAGLVQRSEEGWLLSHDSRTLLASTEAEPESPTDLIGAEAHVFRLPNLPATA